MPRFWYDYHAVTMPENATEEQVAEYEFNRSIMADRKPYFMRYIYPEVMKQYNDYVKQTNTKCVREFRMTVDELMQMDPSERTDDQNEFVLYYNKRMPVSVGDCTMNRICRMVEAELDHLSFSSEEQPFDYTIMKTDAGYNMGQFYKVKKIYDEHTEFIKNVAIAVKNTKTRARNIHDTILAVQQFHADCLDICNNDEALSNIVLDICYKRSATKKFAWDVSGSQIPFNLASKRGYVFRYPALDEDGDIEYAGMRFSMREVVTHGYSKEDDEYDERDYTEREEIGESGD